MADKHFVNLRNFVRCVECKNGFVPFEHMGEYYMCITCRTLSKAA
jgi:ribosomal protein S27E